MSVQARFFIQTITTNAGSGGGKVTMSAVGRGSENKTWAAATPSGNFDMYVNNLRAFEWFQDRLGKEVAITIEDRPALCEICGEEVSASYDVPGDEQGITDYGTDARLFRHRGCVA